MTGIKTSKEGTNRQIDHHAQQYLARALLYALVMHSILIVLIGWFWQKDSKQRMALQPPQVKHTAIKSYLITSQQYQLMQRSHEPPKQLPPPNPIPPQTPAEVDTAPLLTSAPHTLTPNNKPKASTLKKESKHDTSSHTINTATSVLQATSQYMRQHDNQQFEQLIGEQTALKNMPIGTMSEMDAPLDFIELTPQLDTSQPHTLNHKLDPNRIVKQGDYCYRVVNLATQVNPHGWGLGFAEFCGEDKQKQQLTEAINNGMSQVNKAHITEP
ncbi:hypothetical protein [Shewanella sp.]|uniref:hypothetical protein n=1 Tax=Shewanella sp. TaxID=50422 RepID=UPI0040487B91